MIKVTRVFFRDLIPDLAVSNVDKADWYPDLRVLRIGDVVVPVAMAKQFRVAENFVVEPAPIVVAAPDPDAPVPTFERKPAVVLEKRGPGRPPKR